LGRRIKIIINLFGLEIKFMITVSVTIQASIEKVWDFFTKPEHIINWYFASPDWHCPKASNDLHVGAKFNFTMAAKDGSAGFDFEGVYANIELYKQINYGLADGRQVLVSFIQNENSVTVIEKFDPENENSLKLQQAGWQAILDNFKQSVETTY
jgi:uncharacterized protein YndB with AHSA1/START domain